ncbi:putative ABC transporter ATP-binding protein [Kineosphaera limosa NBRC 100340]|uniref:Putative ABC transporter ATP-binding protein n=2 Tax=Kineosphaera TaxID=211469 RepID=K6VL11_9MICO|nr:ATP-binding cassette domain-containing protein [Kineosphaera limosa]GAB96898.1 putative ABC transporter ATP-binding protein [Kineosphaera limosa NBRC 100340]
MTQPHTGRSQTGGSGGSGADPSGLDVHTRDLSLRYGKTRALDDLDLDLGAGRIHGLLGRNGAGKTTLLSILASLLPSGGGVVEVGGRDPFEDEERMSQISLIREGGNTVGDETLSWNLDLHAAIRPTFDRDWAGHLVTQFGLSPDAKPDKLSRGQRSAANAILGLAARAPLTMFDEVHLGMDAPTRQLFTDLLIADVVEHPRTIILSSHLISEIEHLLETVTVLHHGRLLLSAEADDVRRRGVTITGPVAAVDALGRQLSVVAMRDLGPTRQITAYGELDERLLADAERAGLEVSAAPLQDLFIHLTADPTAGNTSGNTATSDPEALS